MQIINIHEAKTHLSRLTEAAAKGESFIIAKAGKPLVQVIPYENIQPPQRIGFMPNLHVPDNFDEMFSDEIEHLFLGAE